MAILHAKTEPDLLTRLRQMLGSAARADIAGGYFFGDSTTILSLVVVLDTHHISHV